MPQRKIITRKMQEKLFKALTAKTPRGRANFVIDAIADEGLHDAVLDSILHGLNEVAFAEGPLDKNLKTWIRKTLRHRKLGR